MPDEPSMTPVALTRPVPPSISRCELTHLSRAPIDPTRATEQHRAYEEALAALGCTVRRLPAAPDLPDSVFVEDLAVVLPEIAVVARPGPASRRQEVPPVARALEEYRPLAFIEPPGTLDGGDVLCVGSRIYVGLSDRTNADAIRQLRALTAPYGYEVRDVAVSGCLHLKTAVTRVARSVVLLNPEWVDAELFDGLERIEVDPAERFAANALLIGDQVLLAAGFPGTRKRLEASGLTVHTIPADELAKAEGGLTCSSILIPT
jgi:dimethylargininase